MTALRHLKLDYNDEKVGKQVAKLLPKFTNLSSYSIESWFSFSVENDLKSMIEEFMNHQPKRLKPLKVFVKKICLWIRLLNLKKCSQNNQSSLLYFNLLLKLSDFMIKTEI